MYFNQRNENEKGQSKDSYGIFIARGLQLLRSNGILSYIVSDTWRTIKSHRPLRKRLLEYTTVFHILDLPSWIFDATVNTGILTVQKIAPEPDHTLIAGDLRAIPNDDWKSLSDNLLAVSSHGPDIQTINCARYTYPQNLISTYDNLSFFVGLPRLYLLMSDDRFQQLDDIADVKQGLATADNEYYIRKREGARGSYEILNETELLTDEEIANLTDDDEKQNGVNPRNYSGHHFVPYDKGGASETEEGWLPNYYVPTEYFIDWSRDAVHRLKTATVADIKRSHGQEDKIRPNDEIKIASRFQNSEYYFREGLTFSSRGVYSPTFRLKCLGPFDKESSCIFTSSNITSLLGVLSSKLTKYLFRIYIQDTVSSDIDAIKQIVVPTNIDLSTYVRQIIENQINNLQYDYVNEQTEIDMRVYGCFNLSENYIREVELWYCRRYPKLAKAQGLLSEVKEKYAAHLERCKRILEKPPSYWRSNRILQLIAQGESHTLEFKETLEHDTRQNQQNRELNKATLKTIAALLNAEGGTILIGVSDSGEVKGINCDLQYVRGNNRDGFEQKLRSLINDRFDPSPLGFIDIGFEELAEGTACRVNVRPANTIIHLDNEVYIRDGNVTRKLEGRALTDWIQQKGN